MSVNLVYMAKPIYGGWVTFTSHLSLKHGCDLYKIGKRMNLIKRLWVWCEISKSKKMI